MNQLKKEWVKFGRIARAHWPVLILLAALLGGLIYAGSAQARDIAAMPNNAGGQIILTDIQSTNGNRIAYSRGPDGTTIFGYWVPGENFILVKWDGGSLKTFKYDDFEPLPRSMLTTPPRTSL